MLFGFTGSHLTAQTIPLASILSQNLPLVETPWSANCLDPNEFVTIWERKGESVVRQFFLDGVPKGEAITFVDINSGVICGS
jgi:hypothetical protein